MKYKNLCRFHSGPHNIYKASPDPRDDCSVCQSVRDQERWSAKNIGHVPGRWCKEHNHCSDCCEVKHLVRVLRHYGGVCSPKKCPACEWARHPSQAPEERFLRSKKARMRIIKRIYSLMLGLKPKYGIIKYGKNNQPVYGKI